MPACIDCLRAGHWLALEKGEREICAFLFQFDRNEYHLRVADVFQIVQRELTRLDVVEVRQPGLIVAFVGRPVIGPLQEAPWGNRGPEIRQNMAMDRHFLAWFKCYVPDPNRVVLEYQVGANLAVIGIGTEFSLDAVGPPLEPACCKLT